jgi:hypothetical protein
MVVGSLLRPAEGFDRPAPKAPRHASLRAPERCSRTRIGSLVDFGTASLCPPRSFLATLQREW